jgi:hypothetical protein
MQRLVLSATLSLFVSANPLSAYAQAPAERGDPTKYLTNCPEAEPGTATTGAADSGITNKSGATGPASQDPAKAQAVEKSSILPAVGGDQESAAPTVQRNGKSVEVRTDCPQPQEAAPKG